MKKTTRTTDRPESSVIRIAVRVATEHAVAPRPRVPLMDRGLGDATIAENVDGLLEEPSR